MKIRLRLFRMVKVVLLQTMKIWARKTINQSRREPRKKKR
jgi:hypothetical protein